MPTVQPDHRIRYVGREVRRSREDAEEWRRGDGAGRDAWVLVQLVERANRIVDGIHETDLALRDGEYEGRFVYTPELQESVRRSLAEFVAFGESLLADAQGAHAEFAEWGGADRLAENVHEAKNILNPADQFFAGDTLAALRDAAIDAHRAGQSEPLIDGRP